MDPRHSIDCRTPERPRPITARSAGLFGRRVVWLGLVFIGLVGCASLLQVSSYQDVTVSLCEAVARCEPEMDVRACEEHLQKGLENLDAQQRHAWLTEVANTAATSSCVPAKQSIDHEWFCQEAQQPCVDGVQCCHFASQEAEGVELCAAGEETQSATCCEVRGFECSPGDCCAGDCQKVSDGRMCCGGTCCVGLEEACGVDVPCCEGRCTDGFCKQVCSDLGASCTSDTGCCEGLYCEDRDGQSTCSNCLDERATCVPQSDDPQAVPCCGDRTCFNAGSLKLGFLCSPCEGLPNGESCSVGSASLDGKEGWCCSSICDRGTCSECRAAGGDCSGEREAQCCEGTKCTDGVCQPCDSDGSSCEASRAAGCCSETCLDGACSSCAKLDERCDMEASAPCCQGVCRADDLDVTTTCQCQPPNETCTIDRDCCGGTLSDGKPGGRICRKFSQNVGGETPIVAEGLCCEQLAAVKAKPCDMTYKLPLVKGSGAEEADKLIIQAVCDQKKHRACCCSEWGAECVKAAKNTGMCTVKMPGGG